MNFRLASIGVLLLWPCLAGAHKASDSYLYLQVQGGSVEMQWDIALRDLEHAIGLDGDDDGVITWQELRARHGMIAAYALSHLEILADESPCTTGVVEHLVDRHSDGAYAVLRMKLDCPPGFRSIGLHYGLLFDLDPLHRGLLRLEYDGQTRTAVLSPDQPGYRADFKPRSNWREFLQFGREGVWHIWTGYDHVLFLLSVLFPAVLWREGRRWRPVAEFPHACWETFKIVTAFTIAHSITLTLATLGIVSVSSRVVESAIAASVILAALNNLHPVLHARLWWVVFAFGIVHGLGFASVLLDLGLADGNLLIDLFGFNLGVETGQLVIVGLFLPLAFAVRRSPLYEHLVLRLGSLLIVGIASVWFVERSFNLELVF